jgi:hypothetical protein
LFVVVIIIFMIAAVVVVFLLLLGTYSRRRLSLRPFWLEWALFWSSFAAEVVVHLCLPPPRMPQIVILAATHNNNIISSTHSNKSIL